MTTTTARRRNTHPMSYYRNMVKDMDDSQKLELVSFIIDSMRSAKADDFTMEEMLEGYPYKHYTKAEMNAMLDKAEANFEAGRGIPDEEAWDDLEEELAFEKQELEMAEAI